MLVWKQIKMIKSKMEIIKMELSFNPKTAGGSI